MGQIEEFMTAEFVELLDELIPDQPMVPPAAARGSAAAKRARAGGVARASSDDEQRPHGHRRFQAQRRELDSRVGERRPGAGAQVDDGARRPVTRAAAKAPAADGGLDSGSTAESVFGVEDESGDERLAGKYSLNSSPVLVTKKNHVQADGDRAPGARPAAKNDKEAAPPEEIFEALRAIIPSLARDDLLRAYSMLIRDERQFRSLMALPRDMRKDWLLMEIGNQQ